MIIKNLIKNSVQEWEKPLLSFIRSNTASGEVITPENSLAIGAIFAAVDIKARHIAKLPVQVFKKADNGRLRESSHPVAKLIERRPNRYQTPYVFKHTLTVHRNLWGNAYVKININKKGDVTSLKLLEPSRVRVVLDANDDLWYLYSDSHGVVHTYHPDEILHFPYLSIDGINGKSPVTIARETAGVMKSAQKYISTFYKNGTTTKGILKTEETLSKDAKNKAREAWEEVNSGMDNANKVAILDGKFDFQSLTMNLVDAEYIATQKFNIAEIARIFNVPLHMLSELDKSSFNNIEHQSMEFVQNTIQPELIAIEEEMNYKLFAEAEHESYYVKFNLRSALRSDDKTRSEYYKTMTEMGAFSINDVLELEDRNGIGVAGDDHRVDLNHVSIDIAKEYQLGKAGASKGGDTGSA
ncbi:MULTISPECIES: phage portal protein [Bacillus]|uniref:phage portal protein n=1 Tax=Bacillus TaxID=1386 RepID=UPI00208DD3A0|nr:MULTISPECIES: phage portal protein [Bacillus]MCY7961354.1 phage portal protein [Bacillus spizizenii]